MPNASLFSENKAIIIGILGGNEMYFVGITAIGFYKFSRIINWLDKFIKYSRCL